MEPTAPFLFSPEIGIHWFEPKMKGTMKTGTTQSGRILIVDDDKVFLNSTIEVLRREGYECNAALNTSLANELLEQENFDLVITDLNMPGDSGLELAESLKNRVEGLPVILVTGYPSIETAIKSIQLPIFSYLVKPLKNDELLTMVKAAIERFRDYRTFLRAQERDNNWHENLKEFEGLLHELPGDAASVPINTFVSLTLRNIFGNLSDLKQLTDALAKRKVAEDACHLLNCPRPKVYLQAIVETIEVLKRTKGAFKSKELGLLRKKLEQLVNDSMKHT